MDRGDFLGLARLIASVTMNLPKSTYRMARFVEAWRPYRSVEYRARIGAAAAGSFLLHIALILFLSWRMQETPIGFAAANDPIVLNLQPSPESLPKSLVDAVAPSSEPVLDSERIATQDSQAQDLIEGGTPDAEPGANSVGEFDDTGSLPAPEVVAAAPPAPPPTEEADSPEPSEDVTEPDAEPEEPRTTLAKLDTPIAEALATPPAPAPPVEAPPVVEAPAVAPEPVHVPTAELPRPGRSRTKGNVELSGFLSFEAMESDIAPYLTEVRRRVEREWRSMLLLRFSGTGATKAVLDCSIRPDGTIAYVKIVEAGNSPTYGSLCKTSVENAGPFPAFTFKVPAMYANKNLDIRWTFSYL